MVSLVILLLWFLFYFGWFGFFVLKWRIAALNEFFLIHRSNENSDWLIIPFEAQNDLKLPSGRRAPAASPSRRQFLVWFDRYVNIGATSIVVWKFKIFC
jgi:hypothetical protein